MHARHAMAVAVFGLLVPSALLANERQSAFVQAVEIIRTQPMWFDTPDVHDRVRDLTAMAGFDLVMETTLVRLAPPVLVKVLPKVITVFHEGEDAVDCATPEEAFKRADGIAEGCR